MNDGHSAIVRERRPSRQNRILILIFGLLIAYVVVCYLLVLASIPIYYQRVVTQTVPTVLVNGETMVSNAQIAGEAAARNMTLPRYAIYNLALNMLIAMGFVLAGLLILWKAQGEWFHWLTAFVLLFSPLGSLDQILRVFDYGYGFFLIGSVLWPTFLLFLYLFPDGRAVPRWSRWPMGAILSIHFFVQLVGLLGYWVTVPGPFWQALFNLFIVVSIGFVLILFCQAYRYLFAATLVERAQIKWFIAALAILIVVPELQPLLDRAIPLPVPGFGADLNNLLFLLIPASITVAILRYRLWDIDVIIRKTLLYTAFTLLLALVFFGSVILLQLGFEALAGQQSQLAIVLSTLASAALFSPLRTRIQSAIDRRFYRKKYDAQQVLAQFAITARDETDMNVLAAELARVVQETMAPEQISVWLRKQEAPKATSGLLERRL